MGLFNRDTVIPVIRLHGAIGISSPLRPGLTMATAAGPVEQAFAMKKAPAVALLINSPGGSAVQSRLIFQRIRDKAKETGKPVYAFTEDAAASGGYMLACAGDEIYSDPSSIVGSIGVVSAGFGLDKFIARFDIERRIYTAGENKVSLDPFLQEKPEDIARLKEIQEDIHATFTDLVRTRRAGRLKGEEADLFDGKFWSGTRALDLGLIDGIGDVRGKMRDLFGDKIKLKAIGARRSLFRPRSLRIGGMSGGEVGRGAPGGLENALMAGFAGDLLATLEQRALWARYGL